MANGSRSRLKFPSNQVDQLQNGPSVREQGTVMGLDIWRRQTADGNMKEPLGIAFGGLRKKVDAQDCKVEDGRRVAAAWLLVSCLKTAQDRDGEEKERQAGCCKAKKELQTIVVHKFDGSYPANPRRGKNGRASDLYHQNGQCDLTATRERHEPEPEEPTKKLVVRAGSHPSGWSEDKNLQSWRPPFQPSRPVRRNLEPELI
ncbi:hypothetical protein B0H11DRAFT_1906386 [Mycena galericulata]|nr:hypothetical protein B0H11DRAFT_1906386 [Mycena galericulata]